MYLFNVIATAAVFSLANSARTITSVSITADLTDGVFNAHLHAAPCAQNGGGHYQNDGIGGVNDQNENWPAITCTSGKCYGTAANTWATRPNDLAAGLSIVVHNNVNGGGKMLCADLAQDSAGVYSGSFSQLASSVTAGDGTVTVTQSKAQLTTLGLDGQISFTLGSAAGAYYASHLHYGDCANLRGHYNINGEGDSNAIDTYEHWPAANCDGNYCYGEDSDDWQPTEAEFEAGLSIVVHDTPDGGQKFLCADLTESSPGVYSGSFSVLSAYTGSETLACPGEAILAKSVTATSISFRQSSFGDNQYSSHLHAAACSSGGGGHYQNDDTGAVDDVNENWPTVTCSDGYCYGEAVSDWLIPKADFEAMISIVVHETPVANAKMFCSDISTTGSMGYHKGSKLDVLSTYEGSSTRPRKSKVSVTQTRAVVSGFSSYSSKSSKNCKSSKGSKGSSSSKVGKAAKISSMMDITSSPGASISVGIAGGLLVVAAAVFVARRRSNKNTEVIASDIIGEDTPLTL